MKILAIKLRAIGDTVIWTSALNALHRAQPDAEIHVLTYAANAAVLRNQPAIAKLHLLKTNRHVALLRKLWSLRAERFDWLLGFHVGNSLVHWGWLAGAKRMALHHHSWRHTPTSSSVRIPEPGQLEDAITRDYQVLNALDLPLERQPTSIIVTPDECARAEAEVARRVRECGGDPARPRMAFLPGAGHFLRRYPKDLLLPLIERCKYEKKYQPLIFADQVVSREWNLPAEAARLGVPLFDRGSLREFMCLLSRAERALANDSGPGHIAVALGLRTDFVFGPGCVGDWHPYDSSLHPVHRAEVRCRLAGPRDQDAFQFCTVTKCPHHSCMRDIPEFTLP